MAQRNQASLSTYPHRPSISGFWPMIEVAGFCLYRCLVCKSRFFVIYSRGETLADGTGLCPIGRLVMGINTTTTEREEDAENIQREETYMR